MNERRFCEFFVQKSTFWHFYRNFNSYVNEISNILCGYYDILNRFHCFLWEPSVVLCDKSSFVEIVINENAMYNKTVIEFVFLWPVLSRSRYAVLSR